MKNKKLKYFIIIVVTFLIFSVIFSDWEHFKEGLGL